MDALTELAAQIMRISAGAGSVARMGRALDRLNEEIADMPDGAALLHQHEAAEALRFTTDDSQEFDEISDSIDEIARHSLRLVASRYQELLTHERLARGKLRDAIRDLEDVRARNRAKHQPLSRKIPDEHVHLTLTDPQKRALKFLAATEGEREGVARPSKASLAELAHGGLARKTKAALGYAITKRGRGARGILLWDEIL